MEAQQKYIVRIATSDDFKYAHFITDEMAYSVAKRGAGIAHRTPEYTMEKMDDGHAVIAINAENGEWAGFCYIEVWQHEKYVANSGLIVSPKYRGMGISKGMKYKLFELSRVKFPHAKLLSLTTSPAVIHVNMELGYKVVPYSDILKDELFLTGCYSWVNYKSLMNNENTVSRYVAMIFDPASERKKPIIFHIGHNILNRKELTEERKRVKAVL